MDLGNIIAEGTKESLKSGIESERQYHIAAEFGRELQTKGLMQIDGVKKAEIKDNTIVIMADRQVENLDKIITELIANGVKINDINAKTASLETVFLQMTGKSLRD